MRTCVRVDLRIRVRACACTFVVCVMSDDGWCYHQSSRCFLFVVCFSSERLPCRERSHGPLLCNSRRCAHWSRSIWIQGDVYPVSCNDFAATARPRSDSVGGISYFRAITTTVQKRLQFAWWRICLLSCGVGTSTFTSVSFSVCSAEYILHFFCFLCLVGVPLVAFEFDFLRMLLGIDSVVMVALVSNSLIMTNWNRSW